MKQVWLLIGLLTLVLEVVYADEVQVQQAEFSQARSGIWSVQVTLKHADTGWDHYADAWRLTDGAGKVFGKRVLFHPHVSEQPFTRGLSRVELPENGVIYVEAHDSVHGWSTQLLKVDLSLAKNGRLSVSQ